MLNYTETRQASQWLSGNYTSLADFGKYELDNEEIMLEESSRFKKPVSNATLESAPYSMALFWTRCVSHVSPLIPLD